MTKKEMFVAIRKVVADNADMVAFIDHELELLDKKRSATRKPTQKQVENLAFKELIYDALVEAGEAITMKDIFDAVPNIKGLSTQRVTHILTALIKEGKVEREIIKKVRYYKAVA